MPRGGMVRKDDALTRRYGAFRRAYRSASTAGLRECDATPHGALALLIVLDQFSAHVYRGPQRAFAGDAQALAWPSP